MVFWSAAITAATLTLNGPAGAQAALMNTPARRVGLEVVNLTKTYTTTPGAPEHAFFGACCIQK